MMQLQAQEIKKISLQEAVTLGLQHSRYLQMDKAKIEEAHAVLLGAQNNQLPDFNWSASYMRLTNAKVDMKMKTGNANHQPSHDRHGQSFFTALCRP